MAEDDTGLTKQISAAGFKNWMFGLSRAGKRVILVCCDGVIMVAALWFSLYLRYGGNLFPREERLDGLYIVLPIFGLSIFWASGLYRYMVRSMESRAIVTLALSSFLVALALPIWSFFDPNLLLPRSTPFLYAMLVFCGSGSVRLVLQTVYRLLTVADVQLQKVVIYGAGEMGLQLASMMEASPLHSVVALVDDNKKLKGSRVRGRRIYSPDQLGWLQEKFGYNGIVLAINSVPSSRRLEIIESLTGLGVPIKTIPSIAEFLEGGNSALSTLKEVRIEDLLGRNQVAPVFKLIEKSVSGKTIMVTGAAGSIGSELVLQLLRAKPAHIVAFDVSEFGLYELERTVDSSKQAGSCEISYCMGSVRNRRMVGQVLRGHNVDIVYHAAAYKHVPLVENNVISAIENNAFGTLTVAEEAKNAGCERFVLVSTDKAVRPTSVMGASKRLSELVVQNLQTKSKKTIFSMVRFGNVLGSSGSVIPLFRKQIEVGGPVTLTHREVTRYFMTVSEAAQLVIHAGFLAVGGEVFVLDMGEPVKLYDMAKLMIQLSGNTVLEEGEHGEGIFIKEIGLRHGEKLYEELLIGDDVTGTTHPKIMRAVEDQLSDADLKIVLAQFVECIEANQNEKAIELLESCAALKRDAAETPRVFIKPEGIGDGVTLDQGLPSIH